MTSEGRSHAMALARTDLYRDAAARHGTPLYLAFEAELRERAGAWLQGLRRLRAASAVCYSYKTNPLLAGCRVLYDEGLDADVSTAWELERALAIGHAPSHIVLNGPIKPAPLLERALSLGVRVNLDDGRELTIASAFAERQASPVAVGLRVSPGSDYEGAEGGDKFGFHLHSGEAARAVRAVQRDRGLRLAGLHVHLGTNAPNGKAHVEALDRIAPLVELAGSLDYVDIGGGFATARVRPMDVRADEWHVERLDSLLADIADAAEAVLVPETSLLVEPGRAVVAGAWSFLTRVGSVKQRPEGQLAILDGGCNLVPSTIYCAHEVTVVPSSSDGGVGSCDLYGPLCMSIDRVAQIGRLVCEGDLVAVEDVGAYNYAESWTFSRGRPRVVWVAPTGAMTIVRDEERAGELDHLEHDLAPVGGRR